MKTPSAIVQRIVLIYLILTFNKHSYAIQNIYIVVLRTFVKCLKRCFDKFDEKCTSKMLGAGTKVNHFRCN